MAAAFSLCSSLTPKLSHSQAPLTISRSRTNISFLSHSLSSLTLTPRKQLALSFIAKSTESEAEAEVAVPLGEPEIEIAVPENEITVPETEITVAETEITAAETEITVGESEITVAESEPSVEIPNQKREEVFAVVMVGSRQYIVFPGRYIYTQRLKGASVNDKITLNKVLLVGTKTSAYIGKPIVPNATVQAVVEEQTLDKKVIVFKYKKKKNYRRNIGHRQPITRIRITSITGYQDSPVSTLP